MFNEEYCNKNSNVVQGKLRNVGVLTVKRPRDYVKKKKKYTKRQRSEKKKKQKEQHRSFFINRSLTKQETIRERNMAQLYKIRDGNDFLNLIFFAILIRRFVSRKLRALAPTIFDDNLCFALFPVFLNRFLRILRQSLEIISR